MCIRDSGYDWPLPFVQGVTRAPSISNQRAIELAIEHDVAIQYDETAQAPFFHYTAADGTIHEVWFEDARSLSAVSYTHLWKTICRREAWTPSGVSSIRPNST